MVHSLTARAAPLAAGSACLALASAGVAAPASAEPFERGTFTEEFSFVVEDYCDVEGLTVEIEGTAEGRYVVVQHGKEGYLHYTGGVTVHETHTNVATGDFVTLRERTREHTLRVTENEDGTFTELILATGNFTVYGSDGKAIARNPGQVRYELLIDLMGTPEDGSDDEVTFLGLVRESTGRNDDFCTAVVEEIG